jgi:hypothetical protein
MKLRNCHAEPARPAGGLDSASKNRSKIKILKRACLPSVLQKSYFFSLSVSKTIIFRENSHFDKLNVTVIFSSATDSDGQVRNGYKGQKELVK